MRSGISPAISTLKAEPKQIMDAVNRSEADLSSLLLEFARGVRGLAFYPSDDEGCRSQREVLLDRTYDAVRAELDRAGTIELDASHTGFGFADLPWLLPPTGLLEELAGAFSQRQIERLRIDTSVERPAIATLVDLLGQPIRSDVTSTDFAESLAHCDAAGVLVNGLVVAPKRRTRDLLETSTIAASDPIPEDALALVEDADDDVSRSEEKPALDDEPLRSLSGDPRGERLRARLCELDQQTEDALYGQRAAEIVEWAEDLWHDDLPEECYRALLVLADHAVGVGGRSETQARTAAACLAELATDAILQDLIERARGFRETSEIRAAQILLQLGAAVVPAVFDQISLATEIERDGAGTLQSLLLALGETILPTLSAEIQGGDDHRARIAIRLAGELQSALALPVLIRASRAPSLERRLETIRALSLLPGVDSKQALETALDSDLDEIVVAATGALATTEGMRAIPAFLDVLEASLESTRTPVCVELINVLGRVGDERVVPRLTAILERRAVIRRAHWHAVQLAALDSLAYLPSKEARRGIERAALHAVRPVRLKALTVLEKIQATAP